MKNNNPYDPKYARAAYYWGTKPSKMAEQSVALARDLGMNRPGLLDLGCGEGRNAVYFAEQGFEVTGLDASQAGLDKMERLARERSVRVKAVHADIVTCRMSEPYDILFSTGSLHYLPAEIRKERFEHFKRHTTPGGLHGLSVFVEKPFVERAPDAEETAHLYRSGELFGYYWDWEILWCAEEIFDCNSSGVAHRHAVNRMIARAV